jgi:hypothetical protein
MTPDPKWLQIFKLEPGHSFSVALDARNLSGYIPPPDVIAFRALAASQEKDVQELLDEAINVIFERKGLPNRIPITSGRRTRRGR